MFFNESSSIKHSKGSGKSGTKKNQSDINNPMIDSMDLSINNPSDALRLLKNYDQLDDNQKDIVRPNIINKFKECGMSLPQNHPIKKDLGDDC